MEEGRSSIPSLLSLYLPTNRKRVSPVRGGDGDITGIPTYKAGILLYPSPSSACWWKDGGGRPPTWIVMDNGYEFDPIQDS